MLNNKNIILVGACGLIGKEFSKSILENSGNLIIVDKDEDSLKSFFDTLTNKYPDKSISYFPLDITSKKSIIAVIQALTKKNQKIDAVVNSSYPKNKNFGRNFFDIDYEDFSENLSIHLGGYFLISQLFAKYFYENKIEGNIINISSIYGVIPPRFEIYRGTKLSNSIEYGAIKAGLIHLSKYIAKYLKGSKIRVNCISPGGILDNQPEAFLLNYKEFCLSKGMLLPEDLSGALIFLLSDSSKFINGQNIIVDDGFIL
jgi:NAD(P)-dependent dehydrogenase (short-subunit alcohol dehydrogenase family)